MNKLNKGEETPKVVLIRQATKDGAIPCKVGGGGLELPRLKDPERSSY